MRVSTLSVVLASIVACRSDRVHDRGSGTSDSSARRADSLATTTRSDTLPQVRPETVQVSARDSAASEQIARIEAYRARMDSLLGTKGPVVRFYARLGRE